METAPFPLLKCIITNEVCCPGVTRAQCGVSHVQYVLYQSVQQSHIASWKVQAVKEHRGATTDLMCNS